MVRALFLPCLVVAVLVASGCIMPGELDDDDGVDAKPVPVLRSDTETTTVPVQGPQVMPQEGPVGEAWTITTPAAVQRLTVTMRWTAEQNAFAMRITAPSGETMMQRGSDQMAVFAPDGPQVGDYVIEPVASGVVVTDTITFQATYTWLEVPEDINATDAIVFSREGNKWVAMITYVAEEADVEALRLDVTTFNGEIIVASGAAPATATLKAWARADSKERAAALVQLVDVSLGIGPDSLTAVAVDKSDRSGSESLGAKVDLRVPVAVHGTLRTSNGGIDLKGLRTDGLTAQTSNGRISGSLTSTGDLAFDTSNGGIDVRITPTASHGLQVETSNGDVRLRLAEAADIGYRLTAETSNGHIRETMDDAALSGADDNAKTLETSGFSDRAVQVNGAVHTSNGDVEFDGA